MKLFLSAVIVFFPLQSDLTFLLASSMLMFAATSACVHFRTAPMSDDAVVDAQFYCPREALPCSAGEYLARGVVRCRILGVYVFART